MSNYADSELEILEVDNECEYENDTTEGNTLDYLKTD